MTAVGPDVSYFQVPIDGTFNRDVFICRHSDGDFKDPNFDVNWTRARANPRIAVMTAYHVYRPASEVAQAARADRIRADTGGIGCVMIDAETWQGAIQGDQSRGLNVLWQLLTARYNGNPHRAWGYGNRSDWMTLWPEPSRPALPSVLAKYSSTIAMGQIPNMIAQQYTDGETRWGVPPGLPVATSPFGNCDHNVFPAFADGAALAAWIGGGHSTAGGDATPIQPTTSEEDDMPSAILKPGESATLPAPETQSGTSVLWLSTDNATGVKDAHGQGVSRAAVRVAIELAPPRRWVDLTLKGQKFETSIGLGNSAPVELGDGVQGVSVVNRSPLTVTVVVAAKPKS